MMLSVAHEKKDYSVRRLLRYHGMNFTRSPVSC
jgi:hypothetical protein